jgi:CheY-like chemotaxis protein/anti-sigma regulatory factor (Ser/Thr protein kinase)
MTAQHLLIVDDEPFNLEIIQEYFEGSSFALDTATNGEDAWILLQGSTRYAAVILDRMMPILDGMGLLKRIKESPHLRYTPVIMQTAAGAPEQVKEGLAAGAYYYLVKPYERESLLTIVRSALADSEARTALQAQLAENGAALKLMASGEFSLQSLDEAAALAAFLAQACPEPERAVLGFSELLVNAIEHGNLAITYDEKSQLRRDDRWNEEIERRQALPENRKKRVHISFTREAEQVLFQIRDEGVGFDWERYLDFDPERAFDPNGRGIALARMASFSALEYVGCGNSVVVTIKHQHG